MSAQKLVRGQIMGDILEHRVSRRPTWNIRSFVIDILECFAVVLGVLVIGWIDVVTGADIHVVSLYFLPLSLAAWRFGRAGAIASSLLCTLTWLAAFYTTINHSLRPYIWIVNFLTQGITFLTVSMLVSQLSRALRIERTRSRVDQLTGLKNRRAFIEHARIALALCRRHSRPVSLAYIDLDNFKSANDTFGHDYGDTLLQECSDTIAASLRASDLAARIGGDEFVIFLPETDGDDAMTLVERIRNALDGAVGFQSAGVTASIGVIADEMATLEIEELLKRADAQMYEVKRANKRTLSVERAKTASGRRTVPFR